MPVFRILAAVAASALLVLGFADAVVGADPIPLTTCG